jgi:DNA polymerase-3 subunit alpha
MPSPFVHLHNHTQFSLLAGAQKIDEMLDRASEFGMSAVSMTDHGNLFAAIKFYKKALKRGIRPIIGVEAYMAAGDRRDRQLAPGQKKPYYHLVLLAENYAGYKNLLKLVSQGYREGFYYKPRIDKALLAERHEGLIALSACLGGEVETLLRQERDAEAERVALEYAALMGNGNYFLEIQDQGLPEEAAINPRLVALARKTGLPLVATNDCHFLRREDHAAHDVLLCIQTGKTVQDADRMRYSQEHYFKSGEEMERVFDWLPESIENTAQIASRCHLLLEGDRPPLPEFAVPEGTTTDAYFAEVARAGFRDRLPVWKTLWARGALRHPLQQYEKRLEDEIRMIQRMGFSGYFLIVWDFIKYARDQAIPVGPGRGSAAGSLVAYCLRITDVDPIELDLIFERFLNPERISMPDIDIDFCFRRRDEVIRYVTEKYGRENVAQIITFGTMAARAVIRDVGRGLNLPYAEVDRIAKLVPFALDATIDKAIAEVPQLKEMHDSDGPGRELLEIARRLEGLTRHASTHAAGVVISPKPIVEYCPLYQSGSDADGITTGYAKDEIEEVGLLKMDFLGLKTLTLIDDCLRMIEKDKGLKIDIEALSLDDPDTYKLFGQARTGGVFQFESGGMQDILRKMKPETFEDLIALNALYRPGPIQSKMIDEFVLRRHGKIPVEYDDPRLEPVLAPTYGAMVYQEQIMKIASVLAGYSLGQADLLRKAMGKKSLDVMEAERERFVSGCRAHAGLAAGKAGEIFDKVVKFAGYGFNRSHSAAYALVAYRTAWLKAHYPVYFMAALLTTEKGDTDKLVKYIGECRDRGIQVLPPDVNVSGLDFTVEGDKVRFGLAAVKNVGEGAVLSILRARESAGRFRSLREFCAAVDRHHVNKRALESLIKAGCLDSLGQLRPRLIGGIDGAMERAQRIHDEGASGQGSLFGGLEAPAAGEIAPETLPDVPAWSQRTLLAYEKETLGFYVTGHPLSEHQDLARDFATHTTAMLQELEGKTDVSLAGLVTALRKRKTKKNEAWASFLLEDIEGACEALVFPRVYAEVQNALVDDTAVLVRGRAECEEERVRFIVDAVTPLAGLREQRAEAANLRLTSTGLTDDLLGQLQALLGAHQGEVPVYANLTLPGRMNVALQLGRSFRIRPSADLTSALVELLGPGSVTYRPAADPPPKSRGGEWGGGAWGAKGRGAR